MLGGLSFFLRGLPFLYQGQEIGMENVVFQDISQVDDINTLDEYQVALAAGLSPKEALASVNRYSRDNARTPYHWDDSENAGFTTGTPWLAVNPNYPRINLKSQRDKADSVYAFYRSLSALRKNPAYQETLVYGETIPYRPEQTNLMAYFRKSAEQTILVVGNFQKEAQDMPLPAAVKQVLMNNLESCEESNQTLHLTGYQFLVLELA
jgi:oligo-1,6-glucosidase